MASLNAQANLAPVSTAEETAVNLTRIIAPVDDELRDVNRCIEQHLSSDIALIRQLGAYIVGSGGKRLRPATLLLSARAFQYEGEAHIALAAVIEFIHTATLLHDDVVDDSDMRRGKLAANAVWGNSASVLVGDFLYSRSFQMMVEVGDMRVMNLMADTTNCIAEGEVMQLLNSHTPSVTEAQYLDTIQRKTARLFESAAELGAILSNQDESVRRRMADYGLRLGTAFQLIDDVLDYSADPDDMGKNIGDDLAEGKPTLPLIHAMQHGTPSQRKAIRASIENGEREHIEDILEIVESTRSLAYTSRRAAEQSRQAREALNGIPDSPYRRSLLDLADFAVARVY